MVRTLRLFAAFFGQFLKRRMAYRSNFWIQVLALAVWSLANLLLIHTLFQAVPTIRGWTRGEVFLIYGVANCSFAFGFTLFYNVFKLPGRYIVEGHLDLLMVRPFNPLLQLLMEDFSAEDSLMFFFGLAVVAYGFGLIGVDPGTGTWLLTLLMVVSGGLVYGGILLAGASLSFWFKDRVGLAGALVEAGDQVAKYPLTIYPTALRVFLSTLLPFGFVAFYPAQVLLPEPSNLLLGLAAPAVGVGMMALAYGIWSQGLRMYESAGS
ncbi:MAG TPA: ABC-2 family transporter protein [bacterium]|nr:ABC-2 family transporter protein [bacterium]